MTKTHSKMIRTYTKMYNENRKKQKQQLIPNIKYYNRLVYKILK